MTVLVTSKDNTTRWALWAFLKQRGVVLPRAEDFQAIGRLSPHTRELLGVVGYNGFVGNVCTMHVAGDGNWMSRGLLRAAFDYPFRQAGMVRVFAHVAEDNKRALRLDEHLGFQELYRVENGWSPGVALLVLTMNAAGCRWLQMKGSTYERKAA